MSSKAPCLVLRLAFLGGTAGADRFKVGIPCFFHVLLEFKNKTSLIRQILLCNCQVVSDLEKNLNSITAPLGHHTGGAVAAISTTKTKKQLQRSASEKFCLTLVKKEVDRILVR